MKKRLFLFASYSRHNVIDDSLLFYLRSLSELGDIVFTMDNDISSKELDKIQKIPNVLKINATERHYEYDFGSHRRGYTFATDAGILGDYEFVYLINDSVYGPTRPLGPILEDMESRNCDVMGMIFLKNCKYAGKPISDHYQSWFIGMRGAIARQPWFAEFIRSVRRHDSKDEVVMKYEVGVSELFAKHNCTMTALVTVSSRQHIMTTPHRAIKAGIPFIKKSPMCIMNMSRKQFPDWLYKICCDSMRQNELFFGTYVPIWQFKLFNAIPIVGKYKKRHGRRGAILLFGSLKIYSFQIK